MALHNQLGKWGEQIACEKLVAEGCAIRDRNWRMGHYEIDIVAMRGSRVVFCEVKTRSDDHFDPLEAVDSRKMTRMVAAAAVYMEANGLQMLEPQFDLFGICGTPGSGYTVEHIADAFEIPLTTYR